MKLSLASLGLGAALMYCLDPNHGRRRRVELKNQATRLGKQGVRAIDIATRDAQNRFRGFIAESRAKMSRETPSDDVIVQRARSRLGRACSHPTLIHTSCQDGRLRLEGYVLEREHDQVLRAMSRVPGVRLVENALQPLDAATRKKFGITPRKPRAGRRMLRPATRFALTCIGTAMGLYGYRRGGLFGNIAAVLGAGMTLRGVTNMKTREFFGLERRPRPIAFTKTLEVQAPPDEVFDWFSTPERFPRFMANVKEVTRRSDGQYHWKVTGPFGTSVAWNASIKRHEPKDHILAWSSEPGSSVINSGVIQCEPNREGTRVTIRMAYAPPFGMLGHGVAKLFGVDPKRQLDTELVRFKSLIEQGKATARGRTIRREELGFEPRETRAQPNSEEQLQLH